MKHPRTVAAVAVLFGLALSGCQTTAGPLPVDSSTTAVPSPSSSELSGHHPDCCRGPKRHRPRQSPGSAPGRRGDDGGVPGQARAGPSGGGPVKGRVQVKGLLVHGLFDEDHGGIRGGERVDGKRPFQGTHGRTPGLGGERAKQRPVGLLGVADRYVPGIRGWMAAGQHRPFHAGGPFADVHRQGLKPELHRYRVGLARDPPDLPSSARESASRHCRG